MKGRKPIPTYMKIVNGNPGKRPIKPDAPIDSIGPRAPAHLSEAAKVEWKRMLKLMPPTVLKATDVAAVAMYCQAYGRWAEAEQQVRENGAIVKSPNGYPIQNPYLAVANKAMEQMMKLAPGLGLTPADRTRIKAEPAKDDGEAQDREMFGT